ncbi:MAG: T9SS type A sorting domain-containing protein [Chitinophagales bacterium]|nr:T9SS type A sorting domain-containing protein [Chitinophagales bacterium]
MNGSEAKARLEHASLKSFRDFRVKFGQEINKATNNIDPNNVFVAGISAGAILSIYSVFLDQNEISSNITFVADGASSSTTIVTIDSAHALRTNGYPMPPIKGIIPMAGGSLYNNIFTNNTSNTNKTAINFMHGTCDEVVNQYEGKVSFKFIDTTSQSPVIFYPNNLDANRYPNAYGSKFLYNLLISTHNKIGFGQVINGGHSVLNIVPDVTTIINGGWDVATKTPGLSFPAPDMSLPINQRDIVFDNISSFMKRVMGVAGYPAWTNHAYSVFPDMPTTGCLTEDLSLENTPITANNITCGAESATINPNLPLGASVVWSVSPSLQIIGSNTGATINFNSNGVTSGTGVITAAVTNHGYTISVNKTINISSPVFPTPIPTTNSAGYDTICSGSKTLTITNLPSSYTSITWTKVGGLTILSQDDSSVTYQRSGPIIQGGILTATIVTPCETKSFNFDINSYRNLNFSPDNIMAFDGECGATILSTGGFPTKLRNNSIHTFTIIYNNALFDGITGADWQFTCGTITNGPTNTWIGNEMKSQVTVHVNSSSSSNCGDIRVRPTNPCSIGTVWRIQDTEYGTCGGGWSLMLYPNPSTSFLEITLKNEEDAIEEKLNMEVLDIMGNVVLKSYIEDGRKQINTSYMQPGKYQIAIYTKDEVVTSSFIVKR